MDDETIAQVVMKYSLLRDSLRALEGVKEDRNGAILDYAALCYTEAQKAAGFLRTELTLELQQRLGLDTLEKQLIEFGNTHIHL